MKLNHFLCGANCDDWICTQQGTIIAQILCGTALHEMEDGLLQFCGVNIFVEEQCDQIGRFLVFVQLFKACGYDF